MPAKTIIFPHSAALRAKHPGHFLVSRPLSQDRISFKLLPSVCCLVPTDLLILCKLHPHWLRSHLENVYHGRWCCVTGDFQFAMVLFTLVNCHDETRKNKGDPSSIAIWLKKIGGYISSLSKPCFHICLFCRQFEVIFQGRGKERKVFSSVVCKYLGVLFNTLQTNRMKMNSIYLGPARSIFSKPTKITSIYSVTKCF